MANGEALRRTHATPVAGTNSQAVQHLAGHFVGNGALANCCLASWAMYTANACVMDVDPAQATVVAEFLTTAVAQDTAAVTPVATTVLILELEAAVVRLAIQHPHQQMVAHALPHHKT